VVQEQPATGFRGAFAKRCQLGVAGQQGRGRPDDGPQHPIEQDRLAADPTVSVCVECLSPDQRRALEHDLELARHIQGALLPDARVSFPGWEFCFEYRPLGLVSGTVSPSGRLEICNAGHPSPLLLRDGELQQIPASGVPVGLFNSARYELSCFDLSPGDRLLMFSDGVIESCGPGGEEFGSEPLARIACDNGARRAADVVRSCLDEVDRFRAGCAATDDVAVMAVARTE
jgi:serine phosphatase RsbU (regulator of sigma subunit)